MKCSDGILTKKLDGIGGVGFDGKRTSWLYFLRADIGQKVPLSIMNKKCMEYNDYVLLPFIREICQLFGWVPGQPVPEWLEAILWSDGEIAQIQTLVFEAREAIDEAERIIRNKHPASGTGTTQPADLTPVFKLLKAIQRKLDGKESLNKKLIEMLHNLFNVELKKDGLNLDGNPRKKSALISFLLVVNEMIDKSCTESNIQKGFRVGGMIDDEASIWPNFGKMMEACKRWGSCSKGFGLPKEVKNHIRAQFQNLGAIQLENGAVSYRDMRDAGLPRGEYSFSMLSFCYLTPCRYKFQSAGD